MALQKQLVPVSLNQGIDTKTDKKQVKGKLLVLRNAFFQSLNELRKRFGFNELSTTPLEQGNALATFQNELLSLTGKTVNSYSPTDDLWYEKGQKIAVSLETNSIVKNSYNQSMVDSTINGGYQLFAYEDSRGGIRYSLTDIESGLLIVSDVLLSETGFKPKVKNLGDYFVILYGDSSDNYLKIRTIDIDNPEVISSASNFATDIMGSNPNYDLCLLNGTLYVGYNQTSGLGFYSLSATLVKSAQYLVATEDAGFAIGLYADETLDQIWVVYNNFTQEIRYLILNDTLTAQILTPNTISVEATAALRITGFADNGESTFYAEFASSYSNKIKKSELDNLGASTPLEDFIFGVGIAGKPFFMNGDYYMLLAYGNIGVVDSPFLIPSNQPTNFLINSSGSVVGKLAPGVASGVLSQDVTALDNTIPEVSLEGLEANYPYLIKYAVTADDGELNSQRGVSSAKFIFGRAMVTKDVSKNLLISGALISMYDGTNVVENGFNVYPEPPSLEVLNGGGTLGVGQYQYQTTFEWTDNQGQVHRSAPSSPKEVDVTSDPYVVSSTTTNGNTNITVASSNGIFPGMTVTGTGVAGLLVSDISGNTVVLSGNASASGTVPLSFSKSVTVDDFSVFNGSTVITGTSYDFELVKVASLKDNYVLIVDDITLSSVKVGMIVVDKYDLLGFTASITNISGNQIILNSTPLDGELRNSLFSFTNSINTTITIGLDSFVVATNDLPRIRVGDVLINDDLVQKTVINIQGNTVTVDAPYTVGDTRIIVLWNSANKVLPGHIFTNANFTGDVTVQSVNRLSGTILVDKEANSSASNQSLVISNTGSVVVSDYNLHLTEKMDARNVVYRTEANGSVLYRTSSLQNPLINVKDALLWSLVDTTSDQVLVGNDLIYTTGGVIENIAPPASDIFGSFKNRVILIPSENTLTWQFSQQAVPGTPIQFNDIFVKNIDQTGGGITAIGTIDEKLILYKGSHIFFTVGDGPTSTGANDDFIEAQLITTDSGCTNRKSVTRMPLGNMYKSEKGIYLLDRSLVVSYLGQDVAEFNNIPITSALLQAELNQVRFSLSSGVILVYDYLVNQWSVYTNLDAIDSCIFDSYQAYVRSSGEVYLEDPAVFTDDGEFIQLYFETAWFQFAGIQGFERIYKMLVVGEYESPHTLNVITRTDFKDVDNQNVEIPVLSDPGVYQYRIFTKIQKCESMKIIMYDTQEAPYGEGLRLSAITLEVGIKQGLNKMPASKSYG